LKRCGNYHKPTPSFNPLSGYLSRFPSSARKQVLKAQKKDEVLSAYIVQQEEGQDAGLILSKLKECATTQNETAKRKKSRLDSIRDIFDGLKSKFAKEKKLKIKTKEPVRILLTDGKL
jgi:hypothetical protein